MKTDTLHRTRLVKSVPTTSHLVGLTQACRRVALGLVACSLALVLLGPAWAADGDLDLSFDPGAGVHRVPMLWDQKYYKDGSNKTIVAGSFTSVGIVANSGIARLFADGSPDSSFTSPITTGYVNNCLLLTPDDPNSQILIAGPFTIPTAGEDYYGLARLNANGTVDTNFARTFTSGGGISIAVQPGGKILVGGYAMAVNGDPGNTYYLLRLNADGTVDGDYPKRSAPGGFVRSIWADPATAQIAPGQVRIFGCFPRFDKPTHLDYTVLMDTDATTVISRIGDDVVNGTILYMAIHDNKMVIVGDFNQVHGTTMNGVARLLTSGGLDPDFNSIGTGANGFVQRVTLDTGNMPVLAGDFTKFDGINCGHFVRLNYNGSVDTNFNTGDLGADDRIWTMFKRGDNTWVIEGAFQSVNGSPRKCIANLAANGTLNPQYTSFAIANPGAAAVSAIQDSPQGLYIVGDMSGYGGKLHRRLARLNFDGTPDASFRPGLDGKTKSVRTQSDGKILVAGNFGTVNGYIPRTSLARFNIDGSLDRTFNPIVVKADGSFADLSMVDTSDNGKILIGGNFAQIADANHVMQTRIAFARLNADGSLDDSFNAFNVQNPVPSSTFIKVNAGGEMNGLYHIAGYAMVDGSPIGFYTRLTSTGALDLTFGPSGGPAPHVNLFDGEARCGTDTTDGKIIIGGDFTHVHDGQGFNIFRGHIARFTVNGVLDETFVANPGANNPIYYMQRQYPKDKIFIGGAFTAYNEAVRNYVARLNPNGSVDTSFDPKAGANGPVYAFDWNDYIRRLRIVGGFTTYQGVSRPGIAQIFASAGSFDPGLLLLLND